MFEFRHVISELGKWGYLGVFFIEMANSATIMFPTPVQTSQLILALTSIRWFGPRGLNSLLLALLVVQAAIPGAKPLLAIVGIVAIASVIIHGASASPISAWYGYKAAEETLVEARESTALGLFRPHDGQVPRLSPEDLHHMLESEAPSIYWTSAPDPRMNITKPRFQAACESCLMRL
jgi:NhaP-type Na+/H+ or K+/H+ antiporter